MPTKKKTIKPAKKAIKKAKIKKLKAQKPKAASKPKATKKAKVVKKVAKKAIKKKLVAKKSVGKPAPKPKASVKTAPKAKQAVQTKIAPSPTRLPTPKPMHQHAFSRGTGKPAHKHVHKQGAKRIIVPPQTAQKPDGAIGRVVHFYDRIKVAIVLLSGKLTVGDKILFKRGEREFMQKIKSIQVQHKPLPHASAGQVVGLKVDEIAPEGSWLIPA